MSKKGIKLFASVLSDMQTTRIELLGGDNEDKRLGQMLEEMKDFKKDEFCQITINGYPSK
jgi:hypothetical protein